MELNQVEYYRVERLGGKEYIAAKSKEAVLKLIGNPKNPTSNASLFGYKLDTLEKITEEEARRAPYFKAFAAEKYKLCADGTWILGMLNVETAPRE